MFSYPHHSNDENNEQNETKCVEPLAVQVTCVVSEPDSVDERSQLTCFIHGTFVITSQIFGHLLSDTEITLTITVNIFTKIIRLKLPIC